MNVNVGLMAKNMTQIYVRIKIQENIICAKETFFWNSATCSCQNDKYLGSIIGDSVATCDKVIDTSKTVPTKTSSAKNALTNFYILFVFLLIFIALLIAASICLIKYQSKQKKYYHITSQIAN